MRIRASWFALFVVPVALVLATAGAATAAPAQPDSRSSAAAADERAEAQAVAAAQAFIAAHPMAAAATGNFIANAVSQNFVMPSNHREWTGALGVYQPGVAAYSLLNFGQYTNRSLGWPVAAGWLTGAGWCTVQFRLDNGSPNAVRQLPDLGSGPHYIGSGTSYFVYPYRSSNPNCPSISTIGTP